MATAKPRATGANAVIGRKGAAEVVSETGVLIPVDAFLAKPFTVDRLLSKVRERIEDRSPFSRPSAGA